MIKPEKFWDFLSKNYDQGEGDLSERGDIEILRKYLTPDDLVLEFACGTGTLAVEIARQVKELHAVDISSKMLAAAERKARARGIENIRFTQSTIFDPGLGSPPYDVVLAFNILHLIENAPEAVGRISELLKPGGHFISNTPCLGEKMERSTSVLFSFFRVSSKLRIIPYINTFMIADLEDMIVQNSFIIAETKIFLDDGVQSDFIAAKKIEI